MIMDLRNIISLKSIIYASVIVLEYNCAAKRSNSEHGCLNTGKYLHWDLEQYTIHLDRDLNIHKLLDQLLFRDSLPPFLRPASNVPLFLFT